MALTKLFSVLPRRNAKADDNDAALDGFQTALKGVDLAALVETVGEVMRGEVVELSRKWCPTPPELSACVRAKMAATRRLIALQADAARVCYEPVPFVSFEMRRQAAKDRLADEGRYLLMEVASDREGYQLAKRGKVPPGSVYVGILGAFYSPPYYQPPTEEPDHDAGPATSEPDAAPADVLDTD